MIIEKHNPYNMRLGKYYEFDDLPKKYQEKFIKDNQELESELFPATINDFIKDLRSSLRKLNIDVDRIRYSGFGNQGDGASFTGTVTAQDGIRLEAEKDYPQDLYYIQTAEELEEAMCSLPPGTTIHISTNSRYFHEHSVTFDFEFDEDELEKWNLANEDKEKAMKYARKVLRDLMKWIYQQIEREYDYLTSREWAIEVLSQNVWVVKSRLELTKKTN